MKFIDYIVGLFTNSEENNGPSGADAIRGAVQELQEIAERQFTVKLGEPDIIDNGGRYFNNPKVEIPIYDGPFSERQHLVFDLPRTPNDGDERFNELLGLLGLSFDTMEEMAGREVNARFVGGNLVVDWDEVESDLEPDGGNPEGGEEDSETENSAAIETETISTDS